MILFYRCVFGTSLPLGLDERFGSAVELQALEFVNGKPMEWRLTANENAITSWTPGIAARQTFAFHDLQVPHAGGTRGTYGRGVSLETRGIGDATVFVWLREGTYALRPELTLLNPR
jgi:hypothetical protein